jgi:hypothetical protein
VIFLMVLPQYSLDHFDVLQRLLQQLKLWGH